MLSLIALLVTQGQTLPWPAYGNDPGGQRYCAATQINKENVAGLEMAWRFRHGDMAAESGQPKSSFECTPLMVDGLLIFSTPFSRVIALDAKTGEKRWTFDPKVDIRKPKASEPLIHRGIVHHDGRIYIGTYDGRLFSLDLKTGHPDAKFGSGGFIDLKKGLKRVDPNTYQIASPPAIVNDLVVMGSTIGDNNDANAGDGSVRAFNSKTGRLVWSFDPAPKGAGAANAWAAISVDPITETVFVPTSSPSPDYWGGNRIDDEGYGNSLVALDAKDGRVKWSYQVVHHDVWDYDIPAQPILAKVKDRPVVIVMTKMGFVFVLDRETGKPVFPVEERPFPPSGLPNEKLSPTQPVPTLPAPLVPLKFEAWGRNEAEMDFTRKNVEGLGGGTVFSPPDLKGIIEMPGTIGGCNWSGGSFDPATQTLYTNVNNTPDKVWLIPISETTKFKIQNPGVAVTMMKGTPYALVRGGLMTKELVPGTKPPWGELIAIDMASGGVRWRKPLGIAPKLKNVPGAEEWGSPSLGGSIVTAGGLVFIAGAQDGVFRAFDAATGKILWQTDLPAGGNATPMSYSIDGKQYVVICAGGHSGFNTVIGDYVLAYALP